jgi:tetratricopeptide (TPR) repeat protein
MKLRFFIIIFLFIGLNANIFSQPISTSTPESMNRAADEDMAEGNIVGALEFYKKVYDETKDKQILAKIAKIEYDLRDYEKAEKAFFRLTSRDKRKEFTELKFWHARSQRCIQ